MPSTMNNCTLYKIASSSVNCYPKEFEDSDHSNISTDDDNAYHKFVRDLATTACYSAD